MSADLRRLLVERFEPGETARGWIELDLDADLRFSPSLLAATDRRLLGVTNASRTPVSVAWSDLASVTAKEHGAVGTLEVRTSGGLTHVWRYTVGKSVAVHKLIQQIGKLKQGIDDSEDSEDSELEDDSPLPPVTKSFARLLRFTKPHARMMSLGFLLTLLGSFFALVQIGRASCRERVYSSG